MKERKKESKKKGRKEGWEREREGERKGGREEKRKAEGRLRKSVLWNKTFWKLSLKSFFQTDCTQIQYSNQRKDKFKALGMDTVFDRIQKEILKLKSPQISLHFT